MDDVQTIKDIVTAVEFQRNEALAKLAQTTAALTAAHREIAAMKHAIDKLTAEGSGAPTGETSPDHREHDEN